MFAMDGDTDAGLRTGDGAGAGVGAALAGATFWRFAESCDMSSSTRLRLTVVGEGKAAFGGGGGGITTLWPEDPACLCVTGTEAGAGASGGAGTCGWTVCWRLTCAETIASSSGRLRFSDGSRWTWAGARVCGVLPFDIEEE